MPKKISSVMQNYLQGIRFSFKFTISVLINLKVGDYGNNAPLKIREGKK